MVEMFSYCRIDELVSHIVALTQHGCQIVRIFSIDPIINPYPAQAIRMCVVYLEEGVDPFADF